MVKNGNHESPETTTSVDHTVDRELFDTYHTATQGLREFYTYLTIPAERKEAITSAWHRGESPDLQLNLSNGELEELVRARDLLKDMLASLPTGDNEVVAELYRWKIAEVLAQVGMVLASNEGDAEEFRILNYAIYGAPNVDTYRAALDWVCHDAETIVADPSASPEAGEAAKKLLDRLSYRENGKEAERGYRELLVPDSEVFNEVRRDHFQDMGFYAALLSGVEVPQGVITERVGDPIIQYILQHNLGDRYTHVKRGSGAWGVSHQEEKLRGPEQYAMDWRRFIGLPVGHEGGTHILERINAEKGPLLLGSVGLERFERGAEGRAVVREQVPYDTFDEFGETIRWRDILRRYIAIAYAEGVDGVPPRESASVYEFVHAIDRMYALAENEDSERAMKLAQNRTDTLLLRVLKGTNGTGAYLKDEVYLDGNINSWAVAAQKGAGAITAGDVAKHDINNDRHTRGLTAVGVIR